VNTQFSFFFLKIPPPAVSFLPSASIVTSNAMNIIALINSLLTNNATPVDASAPEDHAAAERSIDGVEQGGVEFNLVADPDDERNEGSSDESLDGAAPIVANVAEEQGCEERSTDGDEEASVGFEFITHPNASWDESSSDENAGGSSGGDDVSDEDVDQEAGDLQDGDENAPPTTRREDVASAMKLLMSHPMKDIARKTRTKYRSPAELGRFKAHVKEYLLELFSLKYCFAKYPGRFTKCSCLNNLSTACCFDSLAARIGEFF